MRQNYVLIDDFIDLVLSRGVMEQNTAKIVLIVLLVKECVFFQRGQGLIIVQLSHQRAGGSILRGLVVSYPDEARKSQGYPLCIVHQTPPGRVDWRQRKISSLYLPNLDWLKPNIGLDALGAAVVWPRSRDDVAAEEGGLCFQIGLGKARSNLR